MKQSRTPSRRSVLLAAARGLTAAGVASVTARSAFAQAQPIRVGFSIPQSGALSIPGKAVLVARQMWRDDVNARGGLLGLPVELVFYDDQSTPALEPRLYSKLIDIDHVDLLLAPYGTTPAIAVMPLIRQRNRLLLSTFSTGINDAQPHYDRYFHVAPYGVTKVSEFPAGFTRLAARKGLKTIAFLTTDLDSSLTWTEINRQVAKRLGMKIVYDQTYPPTTTDFSSLLRGLNATQPDAVYVASYPTDSVGIIRAVGEIGIAPSVKMFGGGMVGLQNATVLEKLGSQVNGIVNYATYVPERTVETPALQDFFARYAVKAKAAGADELGYYNAQFAYSQGQMLAQAVEATRSLDNGVLAKYIHAEEMHTIAGDIRFGPSGEWTTSGWLQVQFTGVSGNGLEQFRHSGVQPVVDPPEKATAEVRMPFAAARGKTS